MLTRFHLYTKWTVYAVHNFVFVVYIMYVFCFFIVMCDLFILCVSPSFLTLIVFQSPFLYPVYFVSLLKD